MACFIVSFELQDSVRKGPLREGLMSFGGYCPINNTCWAITTNKTPKQIRDHLTTLVGPKDRIFVVRSGTAAAWRNSLGPDYDEWLKKYL